MQEISIGEIVSYLGPNSPPGLVWNIFIYLCFFLGIITMFMQSDKTLLPTLVMAGVIAAAVIDKLQLLARTPVVGQPGFGALILHAAMFVGPLIVAGMTKAPKSRPPAIIGGVIGGVYFFAFWFFVQRGT